MMLWGNKFVGVNDISYNIINLLYLLMGIQCCKQGLLEYAQNLEMENHFLKKNFAKVINFQDGTSYEGMQKNGVPHGQGIETHSNKQFYRGMFKNGMKEGKGYYQFENGVIYDGNFKEN